MRKFLVLLSLMVLASSFGRAVTMGGPYGQSCDINSPLPDVTYTSLPIAVSVVGGMYCPGPNQYCVPEPGVNVFVDGASIAYTSSNVVTTTIKSLANGTHTFAVMDGGVTFFFHFTVAVPVYAPPAPPIFNPIQKPVQPVKNPIR